MFLQQRRWRAALATLVVLTLLGAGYRWSRAAKPARHEATSCALPAQAVGGRHPGMLWVPPGNFELGDSKYPEELPIRRASVSGFWMDRTEVTNDEFAAFVAASHYVTAAERAVDPALHPGLPADLRQPGAVVFLMPREIHGKDDISQWWHYVPGANWRHPGGPATDIAGRGSFPVVEVTFDDAKAYAQWKGSTLPTEAQWEWAARAGQTRAGQDHEQPAQANTWQGLFPMVNSGDDGFVGLAPVGCYAPNGLGLYDMIGNVWELTSDAYAPSHTTAAPDQMPSGMGPGAAASRVIKGGSFLCAPNYCMRYRSGSRQPQDDDLGASHVGFRTIAVEPQA